MQQRLWSTPRTHFEIREFGSEAVLFDTRDGRTHYLSPGAAAILRLLAEAPRADDWLLEELGREFGVNLGDEERAQISLMLTQLDALGLVSSCAASKA